MTTGFLAIWVCPAAVLLLLEVVAELKMVGGRERSVALLPAYLLPAEQLPSSPSRLCLLARPSTPAPLDASLPAQTFEIPQQASHQATQQPKGLRTGILSEFMTLFLTSSWFLLTVVEGSV